MKHVTKQLSWLLAFVLFITSIAATNIPVYADSTIIYIGEGTNEVMPAGTNVKSNFWEGNINIYYYESADSETALYKNSFSNSETGTIGSNEIAIKPYAWHVTYVSQAENNSGTAQPPEYNFKAYPDNSLDNLPVSTPATPAAITLPAGTILPTTSAAINVSVYVGNTKLTDYYEASSPFTLPSASTLASSVGETPFNSALATAGYYLPDLTELFYSVELTDNSASPYSLKLTLVPTVEVTFNENTGTPDLSEIKKYATPNAPIDTTKLPTVAKGGVDFYGWKVSNNNYVSLANVTDDNISSLKQKVSGASTLTAMYKEKIPTFQLDLINQKVTHLLPNRAYVYFTTNWAAYDNPTTNANGEFSYELSTVSNVNLFLYLTPAVSSVSLDSDTIPLRHNTPSNPVTNHTATTARVTNTSDFAGCEFAIRATSNGSDLSWGTSSTFSGLTPVTEYKIYVRHKADVNGFASDQVESAAFTTLAASNGGSTTPTYATPTYTAPSYPVMFNTDGGSTIDCKNIKEGSSIEEIPAPTKEGYEFEGWYSDQELTKAYDANTKITAATTLYAKWTKTEPQPADTSNNELVLTIGKKEANAFGSDKTSDVAPMIKDGKPMLPVSFVAKSLGAKVSWNAKKRLVTIKGKNEKGENITILITIGSKYAYVNGKKVKLTTPAFKKNGRVYTPINIIPKYLGASAKWNKARQEIIITKK